MPNIIYFFLTNIITVEVKPETDKTDNKTIQ
jgi:hypothetical protein